MTTTNDDLHLPNDLQARLAAAGVTDDASREQAPAADPDLHCDGAAFRETTQEQPVQPVLNELLTDFVAVPDSNALAAFWSGVPLELGAPFIAYIEQHIAQAEQNGETEVTAGLRQRLDGVRALHAEQQESTARIAAWVDGLAVAVDNQAVATLWNTIPADREEAFLGAAEHRADALDAAGDAESATRMRHAINTVRQAHQQRLALEDQPPVVRALLGFLHAEDDTIARQVFTERRDLLQPFEAQRQVDAAIATSEHSDERFTQRAALLRELRGMTPHSTTPISNQATAPTQNTTIGGHLNQAGGSMYINSAHVEGSGSAIVVNHIYLERHWMRPQPPQLQRDVIERGADLDAVRQLIAERGTLAIGGRIPATAVQGMAGIGKTTLAQQLALALDTQYPDGSSGKRSDLRWIRRRMCSQF